MSIIAQHIAFIGGGMMGTAMIRGLLSVASVDASRICVADPNAERGRYLVDAFGIRYEIDNVAAVDGATLVVIAVKPQFFDAVAASLRGVLSEDVLVVSIMAGVTVARVREGLGVSHVVRAMPNTPGAIGEGMTAWFADADVPPDARNLADELLRSLGETLAVGNEVKLDMVTAMSGSGPAYVFLLMESMIDAGVHMGLSREEAEKLALHTVKGAALYALASNDGPSTLRNQVTSPGGTTAEALYHMERGGFRHTVMRAIWGAFQRSLSLGGRANRNPDIDA